jgi:hypothetical protein
MKIKARFLLLLAAVSLLTTISCGKKEEQQPVAQSSAPSAAPASSTSPAAPPPAAAPQGAPIASATYSNDPNIRADLLEVRRVSGGALLVKWRTVNTSNQTANYNFDWPDLYFIDPAENKKYSVLADTDGKSIVDVFWGNLEGGQQRGNWAKFPAPPVTSTKISINLPKFPPFEDVALAP